MREKCTHYVSIPLMSVHVSQSVTFSEWYISHMCWIQFMHHCRPTQPCLPMVVCPSILCLEFRDQQRQKLPRRPNWKSLSCVWLFATPWTAACQIPLSMEFSSENTGVGSRSLLQGIFPTQEWNPGPPHCRRILCHLSQQGSPRILMWEACPSSGDLPDPGVEPGSPARGADSSPAEQPGKSKGKEAEAWAD